MRNREQWKRMQAALLVGTMMLAFVGCGSTQQQTSEKTGESSQVKEESKLEAENTPSEEVNELEWLNTGGSLPIVEEGTDKTLSMAIKVYDDAGDIEQHWFYRFIEEEMNINLDVESLTSANANERISLMFADGDLPDIILGAGLSPTQLVTYGAEEGMLADLAPYITKELTPNLYALYEEHPEYKAAVTDSEGHIWSLGYISDAYDRGQIARAFINYDWLEEADMEVPDTLDEFVDMLRKFKERDEDIIPMGGSYTHRNPCLILLNALGYITESATGNTFALRNGEVVIPYADRGAYGEFLKVMNTLYTEGLIDPDFYTMDTAATNAMLSTDKVGFMIQAPFVYTTNFGAWWGAQPLTSEYNDTQQWPVGIASAVKTGQFSVSSKCEDIELAMAFLDWFYDPSSVNYQMSVNGPAATQTEYLYEDISKVSGYELDTEKFSIYYPDYENNKDLYSSKNDYLGKEVYVWSHTQIGYSDPARKPNETLFGYSEDEVPNLYPDVSADGIQGELRHDTAEDGEMNFRAALEDTMVPYITSEVLPTVYMTAQDNQAIDDLKKIVGEYATQETAKFVTGRRALTEDELDAYFDEIEALGYVEMLEIYSKYYQPAD